VISVLTKTSDLYTYVTFEKMTDQLLVCSGDMMFNVFDVYLEFLER